jgi:hypothetical protein
VQDGQRLQQTDEGGNEAHEALGRLGVDRVDGTDGDLQAEQLPRRFDDPAVGDVLAGEQVGDDCSCPRAVADRCPGFPGKRLCRLAPATDDETVNVPANAPHAFRNASSGSSAAAPHVHPTRAGSVLWRRRCPRDITDRTTSRTRRKCPGCVHRQIESACAPIPHRASAAIGVKAWRSAPWTGGLIPVRPSVSDRRSHSHGQRVEPTTTRRGREADAR